MAGLRAALVLLAAGALGAAVVSGGSPADPRTPAALPGLPPPFLGTAVVGSGGLTAAVDAYGDVVDLRAPGPAGPALIDNPAERQAAGTVAADTGIVPRVRMGTGPALPLWRADSVSQRYLPGTNVVRTVARFGPTRVVVTAAANREALAIAAAAKAPAGARAVPSFAVEVESGVGCERAGSGRRQVLFCGAGQARRAVSQTHRIASWRGLETGGAATRMVRMASAADRLWLSRARPLGARAPAWAGRMYRRSLLVLRALTDRSGGAVAAGARDGWAYVWPRDAGAAALAFAAAGYRPEARRVARFLLGLDLRAAARFHGDSMPVPGREAQGDGAGWTAVAARAAGLPSPASTLSWRDRPDYQERDAGTYLASAIASSDVDGPEIPLYGGKSARQPGGSWIGREFGTADGLVRRAGDVGSGLDSAAAWGVRPFSLPALFPTVRRTLLHLAVDQTRFGITPGEAWPEVDPWTAPTAWTAWSLAALSDHAQSRGAVATAARDRGAALRLVAALRRAATLAGVLPERVDARTGVPRSTTPLAWSHAFAILALRQLWP